MTIDAPSEIIVATHPVADGALPPLAGALVRS
jgi:hypothetical protein